MISSLQHCGELRVLGIAGTALALTTANLESLIRAVPQLEQLAFSCRLESLAPLARASSLWRLRLSCTKLDASLPCCWRSELPAMPHLAVLGILDSERDCLTEAQAEPLNAELQARCPLLRMHQFEQNLRSR